VLMHFNSINARFFDALTARFHFVLFFFPKIPEEDSNSSNCLFASCSHPHVHPPIVSSRVCWGVCTYLECAEVSHVVLFCFLCVLVHVLWAGPTRGEYKRYMVPGPGSY